MVSWQITATTIYCDAVCGEVTVMVYQDWSVKCTGCKGQEHPAKEPKANGSKSKQPGRKPGCEGLECAGITQYKNKLLAEEAQNKV